jgi:mRNA-degrading endonuclease toxin of MazEF toxin-antitoxin module
VEVSLEDGLFEDSVVNCDAVATVPKSEFGKFITALSDEKLLAVKRALAFALDLDD